MARSVNSERMADVSPAFTHLDFDVNGLRFPAIAAGPDEGEVLICLHGFPQFADSWDAVLSACAGAGFRAVAFDQRGYSPRARPSHTRDYAVPNLLSDVLGIADQLGAKRFHLVGHDWGGLLAWTLAAQHPDRIRTVTVLATPHPDALRHALLHDKDQQHRSRYIPMFKAPFHVAEGMLLADDAKLLRNVYQGIVPAEQVKANVRRFQEPKALTAALNWYRAWDSKKENGPVTVPTLFIWGSEDMALGRTAAEGTAQFVKGPYRFEPLTGVSHWIADEVPERVNDLLLAHLRQEQPGSIS